MKKLLADTKIGLKIIVPLIVIAMVGFFGAGYTGWQMKKTDDMYSALIDQQVAGVLAMTRAQADVQRVGYSAYRTLFYSGASQAAKDAAVKNTAAIEKLMQRLDEAEAAAPFWKDEIAPFRQRAVEISDIANQGVAFGLRDDDQGALPIMSSIADKTFTFNTDISDWGDRKYAEVNALSDQSTKRTTSTITLTLGFLAVATTASILAALFIAGKGITGPLSQLRDLMTRLANADFSVDVVGQDRKDEVGEMAKTVQVFKENGIRARDLDVEATRLREASERERAVVAREQEKVVAQLADGLSRLSDGDLAFTLNERFGEEYEKLRADFNAAMSKLKQTMQTVSGNTHGIRGGADEISQAADDLSRRTEQQAASLEETAAALDEITATVRTTAENANEARRVVAEASESAKHSGEVVGQAVEAMSKIEKSSQQISQIIGVIDEIAFQTNLLALNAGVEAARAGDAGRGFAVVASEVRALAQRSAEAAKEIKTLISASSTQVDQGVSLVAETGTALKGIVEQVARINHLVADIAASAQEQATGLQQVNTAVNQMDQVTQQNAAMVEESTAASHSLAQETEQLSRLIGQFRTGDAPREVSSAPRRQTHQAAPQRASSPRPAMKTTGYGGAALKPQHQPAEESWEEF